MKLIAVNQFFVLLLALFALSCQSAAPQAVPAFYHWKSYFGLKPAEVAYLQAAEAQRLYLRLFDIDWNERLNAPAPVAEVTIGQQLNQAWEWVPTVFITNRSLKRLPVQDAPELARKLVAKIREKMAAAGVARIPEVQLDCDWTESTREVYFRLLKECRQRLQADHTALSVTIRLHQLRYPERTGLPPADRGMLMFYNMGEVRQWEEPNSILNLEAAAPYLQAESYPLPLDLALPLFRWGVLFREGEMIRLINDLEVEDLQDRSRFYPTANRRFEVVRGTFLKGHYLYAGDRIRVEQVSPQQLRKAARQLRELAWPQQFHLAFYHLDSTAVRHYSPDLLQALTEVLEAPKR